MFTSILSQVSQFANLPGHIRSHSFRLGAATYALMRGYSHDQIQVMGRWNSTAFKNYLRVKSFIVWYVQCIFFVTRPCRWYVWVILFICVALYICTLSILFLLCISILLFFLFPWDLGWAGPCTMLGWPYFTHLNFVYNNHSHISLKYVCCLICLEYYVYSLFVDQ